MNSPVFVKSDHEAYAVFVTKLGGPEVLKPAPIKIPDALDHHIVIEHTAVAVNFVDVYLRAGQKHSHNPEPPFITGVSAVGKVLKMGKGVEGFKVGDRVTYTNSGVGTYCTHVCVKEDRIVHVPDDVSDERAAAGFVRALTSQYLLKQMRTLHPGDRILVHAAAGGVGQILVQWALRLGLKIIATVGSDEKIPLVKSLGIEHVINYSKDDFAEQVKLITSGQGVKVVYESVGKDTFTRSLACLEPKGLLVNYGTSSGQVEGFALQDLHANSLWICRPTLKTYVAKRTDLLLMAKEAFEILGDPKIKLAIEAVLPLTQAAKSHEMLESRSTRGAIVLIP